jgi:hypothetical protein
MMFDRLNMMVGGVRSMAMRCVSMVGCFFVIATLVVLSGLAMMMCSAFVVLCCGGMVFGAFVCHEVLWGLETLALRVRKKLRSHTAPEVAQSPRPRSVLLPEERTTR